PCYYLSSSARVSSLPRDPAAPATYTLSLHDALPISQGRDPQALLGLAQLRIVLDALGAGAELLHLLLEDGGGGFKAGLGGSLLRDRKSTRLNSSHVKISYAVFCLKKKKQDRRRH